MISRYQDAGAKYADHNSSSSNAAAIAVHQSELAYRKNHGTKGKVKSGTRTPPRSPSRSPPRSTAGHHHRHTVAHGGRAAVVVAAQYHGHKRARRESVPKHGQRSKTHAHTAPNSHPADPGRRGSHPKRTPSGRVQLKPLGAGREDALRDKAAAVRQQYHRDKRHSRANEPADPSARRRRESAAAAASATAASAPPALPDIDPAWQQVHGQPQQRVGFRRGVKVAAAQWLDKKLAGAIDDLHEQNVAARETRTIGRDELTYVCCKGCVVS